MGQRAILELCWLLLFRALPSRVKERFLNRPSRRKTIGDNLLTTHTKLSGPIAGGLFPPTEFNPNIGSYVGLLHSRSCIPQVFQPVVSFYPVDVVDLHERPAPMHMEPSQPVRKVHTPIKGNAQIPFVMHRPRSGSSPRAGACPSKNASIGVVVEKFAQALRGKIGLSHDAPRKRIGQRPTGVSRTAWASSFSIGRPYNARGGR